MTISFDFNGSMEVRDAELEASAEETAKGIEELLKDFLFPYSVSVEVTNYKVRKENK